MEKNIPSASEAQGAVDASLTSPAMIRQYLIKDLSVAIACLNAIASDPDLLEQVAHFIAGRYSNAQNAKANGHSN